MPRRRVADVMHHRCPACHVVLYSRVSLCAHQRQNPACNPFRGSSSVMQFDASGSSSEYDENEPGIDDSTDFIDTNNDTEDSSSSISSIVDDQIIAELDQQSYFSDGRDGHSDSSTNSDKSSSSTDTDSTSNESNILLNGHTISLTDIHHPQITTEPDEHIPLEDESELGSVDSSNHSSNPDISMDVSRELNNSHDTSTSTTLVQDNVDNRLVLSRLNVDDQVRVDLLKLCYEMSAPNYAYDRIMRWARISQLRGYNFSINQGTRDVILRDLSE